MRSESELRDKLKILEAPKEPARTIGGIAADVFLEGYKFGLLFALGEVEG